MTYKPSGPNDSTLPPLVEGGRARGGEQEQEEEVEEEVEEVEMSG